MSSDTLFLKQISKLTDMGYSITICADNTGKYKYLIIINDGYGYEAKSCGDNIHNIIYEFFNLLTFDHK